VPSPTSWHKSLGGENLGELSHRAPRLRQLKKSCQQPLLSAVRLEAIALEPPTIRRRRVRSQTLGALRRERCTGSTSDERAFVGSNASTIRRISSASGDSVETRM